MKIFFLVLTILIISSCENDEKKSVEKKVFIVSKFNADNEKLAQEAVDKNPELSSIKEIKLYDYPKGVLNFIILNDGTVYFYNEELIRILCGWDLDKIEPLKRILSKDSLHQINYNKIYSLLQTKSFDNNMKDHYDRLFPLSFSFESDTIKNYDIYKLLEDIDSLGYHSYNVRRIAPFESEVLQNK